MFVLLVSLCLVCQLWAYEDAISNALSNDRRLQEQLRPTAREMAEDDRVKLPVFMGSVCCAAMVGGCLGTTLLPLECTPVLKISVGVATSAPLVLCALRSPTVARKLNALYASFVQMINRHEEEFLN